MSVVKIITTVTGSVYEVDVEDGYWRKNTGSWNRLWKIHSVGNDVSSWDDVHACDGQDVAVGKRMYISGKDEYWLSTAVISIAEVATKG